MLLDGEDFTISWANLDDFNALSFRCSPANESFGKGLSIYRDADLKSKTLSYLAPMYADEPQKQQFFKDGIKRTSHKDAGFPFGYSIKFVFEVLPPATSAFV